MTITPQHQLHSTPSRPNVSDTDRGAFVTSRADAPAYWFYGTLWVVLADVHQTGVWYTVMEQWMRGGIGPASHVHTVDEWFFVLEGSMDMRVDGRELTAKPGDSIWIPRGTDHGFTTTDEGAHAPNRSTAGRRTLPRWKRCSQRSLMFTLRTIPTRCSLVRATG
jgi:mannose-6-phosphate isomerase-like protein (cupin superfamily)